MSLWTKVQTLNQAAVHKIHSLYGDHFPIEVRYVLAGWIEDKIIVGGSGQTLQPQLTEIDPDNPSHEPYIKSFLQELLVQLETKANQLQDDPYYLSIKLLNAVGNLRQRYSMDPFQLFRFLKYAIAMELGFVSQEMSGSGGLSSPISSDAELITTTLESIKRRTVESGELLRRMEGDQEAFAIKCHERQKLEGIIHLHRHQSASTPPTLQTQQLTASLQQQTQRLEAELKAKITDLMRLKHELEDKITTTVAELTKLQIKILDEELTRWKREQQLAGNGAPLTNNLDTLQAWCEDLAELIWHNRHYLKEAERLRGAVPGFDQGGGGGDSELRALQEKVTQLLSSLVTSTFIVEKQPPQVMKTNTRFVSTVRLLVGGRLNVHMTPPQVKVAIISEAQANSLLRNDKGEKPCETSGEILNNTGTMEYHQGTKHLSVHFRNMQLKRIKRTEKKGTESVMDEKFCLHFQCQFTVGEKELIFKIWTLSLPVVVIVHGNQEPHAWATVTWDNAFGEPGRMPFQVPERVPWFRVGQALNVKFKSMTGRALTEDNLRFLAEKGFRTPVPLGGGLNQNNDPLTWSQFCKDPLPDKTFTFWEWFYAIMKLTREHLRGPWVDGSILGFVGRQQAEDMLSICTPGTFLLRFSDSELGGVTIAWVHNDQKVFSLAPFTSKDLATRSLADRVHDISHLHFLYPDKTKEKAFGRYYTPLPDATPTSGKGYVKPMLVTHIPGLGEVYPSSYSSPSTPASNYPASPDGSHLAGGGQDVSFPSDLLLESMEENYDESLLGLEDFDLSFQIESYLEAGAAAAAAAAGANMNSEGGNGGNNFKQEG